MGHPICLVYPTQIAQWKKQTLDGLPSVFSTRASEQQKSSEELIATLYQQIGQLKVQVDWLEKFIFLVAYRLINKNQARHIAPQHLV